jgi:single-strand DNA-binding protein
MNLNKVLIAGRLTRDPEGKVLPSGQNVCNFSLATSSSYKNKAGETVESTEYHNVVVFGAAAENSARFLRKGAVALIEGKLQTRSWDKDGVKHYRTEVLADRVHFGPKVSGKPEVETVNVLPDYPIEDINPDDLPF